MSVAGDINCPMAEAGAPSHNRIMVHGLLCS